MRRLHDHGIGIQGCFVFGFDDEDASVFERTVEFVDKAKIDLPRYAVATPFPGTPLYRRLEAEGRLLHRNWSLYDVEHVVFEPRGMSPERLQEGLQWSWEQSYSWGSLVRRISGRAVENSAALALHESWIPIFRPQSPQQSSQSLSG